MVLLAPVQKPKYHQLNTDEEIKNKILDKCIVSSLHPNVYMLEVKARLPLIGKDHHKIICHGMVIFMYRIYLTKFVNWTLEGPSRLHEQSSLVNIPLCCCVHWDKKFHCEEFK